MIKCREKRAVPKWTENSCDPVPGIPITRNKSTTLWDNPTTNTFIALEFGKL